MASEVEIPESLVRQAPQDAIGILKNEKEAKNDLVVEDGNNENTDGECFLYSPSVGKVVAAEAHLESGLGEQEEIVISDSNAINRRMDSKNVECGESEAEIEHVKKGKEETNVNVSNHNNLLEVQAVEVPICVPSQISEIFEKDKKSESIADPMTLLGKVEAPITEGEYSLVQCSAAVAGSEEMEQSEKKLTGGDEESAVDGASVVSQTAFSSVESNKVLTSQNAEEVMEAIQPPESTNVEEKVCLLQVRNDIKFEEESSHLFEEIGQEKTATIEKLKDELTVKNTNAKSNDVRDMGSEELANGETENLYSKIDTEVTTEENLKENSDELVSNDQESLQTEEHLELVPSCSEKEISSELINADECIEKQAIKQTETDKKCEEETVTMVSEDVLAVETTKETTATEEGDTELFVADSEIQEKEVDNFNTSGVPEENTLETDAEEMNSPEKISKNENDFSLGHNEVVDSLEKEAESREKQETEDPFGEETHNSNASEEGKTTQSAVLEGSLVEAAIAKDLYSATSILGEKSEEILISGEEKRLQDDDDDANRNLPMEEEQDESAFSEEENTHEVTKNIMPDSNARELVGSHEDEKSEGKLEDSKQQETADDRVSEVRLEPSILGKEDTAEDNMEDQKSVEEIPNPERSTSSLEGPPLEELKEVVSVQAAEGVDDTCTPLKTTENDLKTPEKIDDKLEQESFIVNPEAQVLDMRDQADHEVHNCGESSEQMDVNREEGAVDLTCQHEDDEPKDLDKASLNFEEVTNEERESETPNTTKEEITDSLSKEESVVKEITEEASDCHNTIQESTEMVEAEICQAKGIADVRERTSEEDNASGNQITDADKEITETTYAAHIVVEEKDRDGVENGTISAGSEEKESTFEKNVYHVESSTQSDFAMESGTQKSIEEAEVLQTDNDHTISTAQQEEKSEKENDLGEVNEGVLKGEILSREEVTSLECSEAVELKYECSSNVPLGQKESASSNKEDDAIATRDIEKVYNLDEIIEKDTSEESVDKHTEDEKCNMIQETGQKIEDVPRETPTDNIPEDFRQMPPTDVDILAESHRKDSQLELDDQPTNTNTFSQTASGGTENEQINQEDHLNESTLEVEIEDNISTSSNIKDKGCPPVVTDTPEAVEDDDVINERSGDANSEEEQKQATSVNVEAIGAAIDAEDTINKQDDATNISNDGLQILKGKGEASDGDTSYQENDSPINDEVCTKENTEPADAIEKSSPSAEPNEPETDESQPVMNSHLEEHGSITESETDVLANGSESIEVGQKEREVDLEETQNIEREVEEDVPHIAAKIADDKGKIETVKEDSSQQCNTTESDKNELPKDGQENEQVGFDDINGTKLIEDAEIGTYRSEENSNDKEIKETDEESIHQAESLGTSDDSLQVFEVQDEANKELENIKEENSNNIIDVVSAKEVSESGVIIDKNDHQTNLEAEDNIPSVEANECASDETIGAMKYQDADPSEHLSLEVHKEQGLCATEVVTEIKDEESANDEGNVDKTASAVELDEETPSFTKVTEENCQQVIIEESVDKEYSESTASEMENHVPINDDHTKISNVEDETTNIDAESRVPINDEYTEASNVEEESTLSQKHDNPDDRVDNAIRHAISEEEIIDAVEVEKLECGPENNNLTDPDKEETDATGRTLNDPVAKTRSAEVPEINFAKCSLEKVEDETQLTDELEADEKSQVSEEHSKEEDFQQATSEERTEIEVENEKHTFMSDNKNVHEGEKMSELHNSNEMGGPHSGKDENLAEESLVPNDSSVEIQNQLIATVVEASGENIDEKMDILNQEESHEPSYDEKQTVVVNGVAGINAEGHTNENDVSETINSTSAEEVKYATSVKVEDKEVVTKEPDSSTVAKTFEECPQLEQSQLCEIPKSSIEAQDIEVKEKQECNCDETEEKKGIVSVEDKDESSEEAGALVAPTYEDQTTSGESLSSLDFPKDYDETADKNEIVKEEDDSGEVKKTGTSLEDDSLIETDKERIPLEVCHSSEDASASEFDVADDKTEEGQQGTHCDDITNKMETVMEDKKNNLSEEPGVPNDVTTREACSEVTQSSEDTMASELEILPHGITNEKLGNVSSEAAQNTASDVKDDLSNELGASTGDKMSEECVPIDENQSPIDVSNFKFDNQKVEAEEKVQEEDCGGIGCETETVNMEVKETSLDSGSSVTEKVSKGCEPIQESPLPENTLKEEGIEEQKQGEINGEIAWKPEIMKVEFKDEMPEETSTKTEESSPLVEESQSSRDVPISKFNTPTEVEDNLDRESGGSVPPKVSTECLDSEECHSSKDVLASEFDIVNEDIANGQKQEEIFNETACKTETVNAETKDDLPEEPGASVEKMIGEAIEDEQGVVWDETVNVEMKVDVPEEPDSLSVEKASEGMPSQEHQLHNDVLDSDLDVPKEGDQEVKENGFDEAACEAETVQAQVNNDLLKEGASDVEVKVDLPDEPDSLSAAATSEEGASFGKNQSNSVESSGFDIPEEGEKQTGDDSLSAVKIPEESMPSGQSQSSEHVLISTFDIPREGDREEKGDDSNDISCGMEPLHAQVTDNLLKEPDVYSQECAALEENQSSKDVLDSELDVPEDDTKEVEKHGEERPPDSYFEKQIADETERQVDDSNVDSESVDMKQVQELDITEVTDKSSMGEPGESPLEFESGNQPSNNSESIVNSLTQEMTAETELEFSTKSEETNIVTPQTDATSESQEQNGSSEQKSGLYDQELTKSEETMGENQCKDEEINELVAKENQSEIECEKYEAKTCDTNNEKNTEPAGTLEMQNNPSEALDFGEKNTALSDANGEEIAETSAEDQAIGTTQTAKELESRDECLGREPTQEDFHQATREITNYQVNSVDAKDDAPGLTSETIASKLDEANVQKEHEGTGCNEMDEPSLVKDKEVINPGFDDGSNIDKPNQQAGIGVEATESHLDSDKNVQNHDDSVEISNDTEVVQVQEREGKGAEYHIANVSDEEVKSVGKPCEAETFYAEAKCTSQGDHNGSDVKTPEEGALQQEGDPEHIIAQEVDVSIEKLQEKQQILEKEEPREQENIQKAINICSTVENEEEITAFDIITREIDVSSAANDGILYHPKVEEDENIGARDANADYSAQNLMVDGKDGGDKSPKLRSDMLSQEPEELSAADIIANQISLDIEREEQRQQLSSEQVQEHEPTVVGSDTLDIDNHAVNGNTVAMNFDETTRMSCLPKDGPTDLGVPGSECGLEQTGLEENQKTINSEFVDEPENTVTTEADKATTRDAEKHEDTSQASSLEETEAQSQTEDRQNTEESPEDDEKQHILAKANEIPEEKVLCHDLEAAPQDSQNESPDNSENATIAGKHDSDNEVNLSSVVSQMEEEAIKTCDIPHMPTVQEKPLEEKGDAIELSDNSENVVTAGEQDRGTEVNFSSIASQKGEEATKSCIIPHMSKVEAQPLEEKEIKIESPDNTENAVTTGELDRGAEVDISSIVSQKDEEATKSCIIPHMPKVQEQMLDEKGVRMEDNKDKDLHETRQMEETKNNHDDTARGTPIVQEEKLLENHGSTPGKDQMEANTSKTVSAEQDPIGSCPTESHAEEVVSLVPQNAVKETLPMAGAENSILGKDKTDEKGCLEQKGESILADSTNISLADVMQRSGVQTCQTDEEKHIIPREKTPDKEDSAAEELQTDEEKDEEGNFDKAPFITEAMREFDIKATNKKSHNILSGVGSKVKHSISKVKKAITCSSSQFASDDVIVKLNKNKKS